MKGSIKEQSFLISYERAVYHNDVLKAFEIIVENLEWYNKNKNG